MYIMHTTILVLYNLHLSQKVHFHNILYNLQMNSQTWEEGGSLSNFVCGCACWTPKIHHSLYLKKHNIWTLQYTIFCRKTTNLGQIGCFLVKISQNTPNFANWVHWVSDRNPPIDIPNFMKIQPKRQAHIRIQAYAE